MIGQSRNIDKKYCKVIFENIIKNENKFIDKFGNRKILHIPNSLEGWFWKEIPFEIKQHLEENIYPFDKKIVSTWVSIIDGDDDSPGFQGLHQDLYFSPEAEDLSIKLKTYITSIIIYKSDDFKGGQFIIGGDGWTDNFTGPEAERTRASRKGNLTHRLKVIENQDVGESFTWSDFTIHGVAEVTSGRRITLMILKSYEDDE